MEPGLISCFLMIVLLIAAVVLLIYIVIPLMALVFTFVGRSIRFIVHEVRDILLLPIALFVGVIKVLRSILCVVLARWDVASTEMSAAKVRFNEAWDRLTAILIDNPLGIIGINTKAAGKAKHKTIKRKLARAMDKAEAFVVASKDAAQHRRSPAGPANQFAGYKVIGTLPSGGSGAKIYVAQPLSESSTVVIKCFDITGGSVLPQIVRESRSMEAAKKLGLIIEHHLDNERFWYAMPHHAGDHLGVVTGKIHGSNTKLSPNHLRTMLSYQQSLLQTLHEYHNAGLWHKDVKPDNIIIQGGSAHLVDLGLVTPLASAMTLTTHGTEYFRDPELVRQAMRGVKVHQVDGSKFDVFSAGAVLYFMLENTFPAHGCLSDFSKPSPEGIRWIVRRAMADYDKRYTSVAEMLGDIEAVLRASDLASVRPADLPSMQGEKVILDTPPANAKRLPLRSTPSTGGGPFRTKKYKTSPLGLVAIIAAIIFGVNYVFVTTPEEVVPEVVVTAAAASILDHPQPSGRVLLINEFHIGNPETGRVASNLVAQLGVAGWEVLYDSEQEVRVRSWLPAEPASNPALAKRLEEEKLAGILVLHEGEEGTIVATLVEFESTNTFVIDNLSSE